MAERPIKEVMLGGATGPFNAERFVAVMLERHNTTVLPAAPKNTEGERHEHKNDRQPQTQLQLF